MIKLGVQYEAKMTAESAIRCAFASALDHVMKTYQTDGAIELIAYEAKVEQANFQAFRVVISVPSSLLRPSVELLREVVENSFEHVLTSAFDEMKKQIKNNNIKPFMVDGSVESVEPVEIMPVVMQIYCDPPLLRFDPTNN